MLIKVYQSSVGWGHVKYSRVDSCAKTAQFVLQIVCVWWEVVVITYKLDKLEIFTGQGQRINFSRPEYVGDYFASNKAVRGKIDR